MWRSRTLKEHKIKGIGEGYSIEVKKEQTAKNMTCYSC